MLVYPAIDDDLDTPSMHAFDGPHITREDLRVYLERYASVEGAHSSPYALPGWAASVVGLPPTILAIPGHDPLRSAEEHYAQRLRDAGVPVTVQLDHELTHAWIDFAPRVPSAHRAFTRLTASINELIRKASAPA